MASERKSVSVDFPSYKLSAVTKKINQIKKLLESDSYISKDVILYVRDEYYEKYEDLRQTVDEQLQDFEVSTEDKAKLKEWYDTRMKPHNEFEAILKDWLQSKENEIHMTSSMVDAKDSVSQAGDDQKSNISEVSASSSAKIKLKERKAKLEADKQFQQEEAELREKLRILKLKKEEQEIELLEKQFNNGDAKSVISASVCMDRKYGHHNKIVRKNAQLSSEPNSKHLNFDANVPNSTDFSIMLAKQNEISLLLARNQEKVFLPRHEPPIFDGSDPLDYKNFMLSFNKTIETKCEDDSDKFYFLLKYTNGPPNELVKSCNRDDLSEGYRAAMLLLKKQYGNEHKMAECIYQRLERWPQIKGEDGKTLNELAMFLTSCTNLMNTIDPLNQLNSPRIIMSVIHKLPFDLRKRWRQKAYNYQEAGHEIKFLNLSEFISTHAAILNTPLYSDIQDNRENKIKKFPSYEGKKKCFGTTVAHPSERVKYCIYCKKTNHDIGYCIFFNKKPYTEKIEFIKKSRACFACLKIANHFSKFCGNRLECSHCGRKHPSCLHKRDEAAEIDQKRDIATVKESTENDKHVNIFRSTSEAQPDDEPTTSKSKAFSVKIDQNYSSTGTGHETRVVSAAVPVLLRSKKCVKFIKTYMAMDPWATGCFIDEALLQELGDCGESVNIKLTTMQSIESNISCRILEQLEITSLDKKETANLYGVYSKKNWPFTLDDSPIPADFGKFPELQEIPFQFLPGKKIGILVGVQESNINRPLDMISSHCANGPYATLHKFGWALNGPITFNRFCKEVSCHRIKIETDIKLEKDIQQYFSHDFSDNESEIMGPSIEDLCWEQKVRSSLKQRSDSCFELCLPFRENDVLFPNNYSQIYRRLNGLKRRLINDEKFYEDYTDFMKTMLDRKFIEQVPDEELYKKPGKLFFISHHGVYHKMKQKIRVVFDCSARFDGTSLNDKLMQGPDLTNNLLGVLLRFRQERIAFSCDIEKMFYMVKVNKDDSDFMRFLWYPSGDLSKEPLQYRLLVHVFGAVSSPSCSNFALRYTVSDDKTDIDPEVRETILKAFYVDDCMKSTDTNERAIRLLHNVRRQVAEGGFNLTGFVSNSRSVLDSIPFKELNKNLKSIDLINEELPNEQALGVAWNVERDALGFSLKFKAAPPTRRGLLSTVSSLFDPLGIAGPIIVPARKIFQTTCHLKLGWNDKLPDDIMEKWNQWQSQLCSLSKYEVPRCLRKTMYNVKNVQLHLFCDGSQTAYGCVAYARYMNDQGLIICSIIMAKSRLTPLNNSTLCTVPRIELNSAKLAIKVQQILHRELEISFDSEYFWSDSSTVLKYINSETGRFKRFVSNRVAYIRSNSKPQQWHYVPTNRNPADLISRGCTSTELVANKEWTNGPEFLYHSREYWPRNYNIEPIADQDPELVKGCRVLVGCIHNQDAVDKLLESTSNFYKLKCRIAWFLRLKACLQNKTWIKSDISVTELKVAENEIWRLIQRSAFSNEVQLLSHQTNQEDKRNVLKRKSPLAKLNPFMDRTGIIRVGGRLRRSSMTFETKHPVILPPDSHAVRVLVRQIHRTVGHLGRESVLTAIRQKYWIINCGALVRKILRDCIICRKSHQKPSQQIMADLPEDRVTSSESAFSRTGVDYFGPIVVMRGRTTEKRYGVIFTCLATRAVHLEIAHSLDTNSFICALRRFMARRGKISKLRSDNGTNFVGAQRELKIAIAAWNKEHIVQWMKQEDIEWVFNPPLAPHFGGIWEREIKTVKQVLNSMISEQNIKLKDEALHTLMCEVEFILNNRPLTAISQDPDDYEPLTPNHLLLLQSDAAFPPGIFTKDDLYVRQRWRQVQYLAELFWTRWRREYLTLLQERQKWHIVRASHQVGDLVLVVDQLLPRGQWCTGRISSIIEDSKGSVRVVKVKIAKKKSNINSVATTVELERPITKLILLKSFDSLNS